MKKMNKDSFSENSERSISRVKAHNLIRVLGFNGEAETLSNLVDISATGLSFVSKIKLKVSDRIKIRLKVPTLDGKLEDYELKAEVAWFKSIPGRSDSLTGVKFIQMSAKDGEQVKSFIENRRPVKVVKRLAVRHRHVFGTSYWFKLILSSPYSIWLSGFHQLTKNKITKYQTMKFVKIVQKYNY